MESEEIYLTTKTIAMSDVLIESIQHKHGDEDDIEGYIINTNKGNISFLVNNQHQCCERFGYLSTPDNHSEYINENILNITITHNYTVDENDGDTLTNNIMFITLNTTSGDLQFSAYNVHNGYYGHEVDIVILNEKYNGIV